MYQRIDVACECGHQPTRVREVGLTADRQLVIYWRCSHCRRHMYIVKALADYWRECPSHIPQNECKTGYDARDAVFLRSVGICLPEDERAPR